MNEKRNVIFVYITSFYKAHWLLIEAQPDYILSAQNTRNFFFVGKIIMLNHWYDVDGVTTGISAFPLKKQKQNIIKMTEEWT